MQSISFVWNNQGIERDASPGTKCCPHVDDPKRITLQHAAFDCPTPSCNASYTTTLTGDGDTEKIMSLSGHDDHAAEVDLGFEFVVILVVCAALSAQRLAWQHSLT